MADNNAPAPSLALFASRYQTKVTFVTLSPGAWTQVCQLDPRRWALRLQNITSSSTNVIYAPVSSTATPTSTSPNPAPFEIKSRDYPAQVGSSWFAFGTTGGIVMVTEEIFLG